MKQINKKRIVVYTLFTIIFLGMLSAFIPKIQNAMFPELTATSANKRKLPIYCVDTLGKPQISISFDAAWGAC